MRVDERVRSLQTYEISLLDTQNTQETAFKVSKNERKKNSKL